MDRAIFMWVYFLVKVGHACDYIGCNPPFLAGMARSYRPYPRRPSVEAARFMIPVNRASL